MCFRQLLEGICGEIISMEKKGQNNQGKEVHFCVAKVLNVMVYLTEHWFWRENKLNFGFLFFFQQIKTS